MPTLNRSSSHVESMSLSRKLSRSVTYSHQSDQSADSSTETISKHRRRVVFLILACSNVVNNMCLALIAPIFPPVVSIDYYHFQNERNHYLLSCLWLIHTTREQHRGWYKEQEWHKRKQWVLVPVSVLDLYEHLFMVPCFPFVTCTRLYPIPVLCEYTITESGSLSLQGI